jgi:hypothetical protein
MTMRKLDGRVKVTRRRFLQGSAAAVPAGALATGGIAVGPEAAWAASAGTLSPHVMATLTLMARDTYPHDQIGDIHYQKAVAHWNDDAAQSADKQTLIVSGVAMLDAQANARYGSDYLNVPAEADRVTILKASETSPFFQAVRGDLVVSLYNQHDLWAKFGYEGSSAQLGGYLHRGFSDIDWLASS